MSTQMCSKVVVLALRSVCCHTHSSRPCIRAVLAPKVPSGPCVLMPQRRAYSSDARSSVPWSLERTSPSSTLTQRNLSALQSRPVSRYDFLDVSADAENVPQVKPTNGVRNTYIVDPALAELVTQHLGPDLETAIFECNPGPGVLTRTLLNAGAQRLVALENDKYYLPYLQELEGRLDGQLEVVNCNFWGLNPLIGGNMLKTSADKLFTDLGISKANWTDDIPVKVFSILPQVRERAALLKLVYSLFERTSVYRYGRIELFLFMSESEYLKMMAGPADLFRYTNLSVLCQMAFDVKLLHKEPWESFVRSKPCLTPKKTCNHKLQVPDPLCLVHLSPRADLFSSGLNPDNASTLFVMVKQVMAVRKAKLINKLNQWFPDDGSKLLSEMGMPEDIMTGHVFPDEYLRLFEMFEKSSKFKDSWL